MKKSFIVFLLMISTGLAAQNDEAYVDTQVNGFTASLEKRGISTYYTVKRFCLGEIEMFQLSNGKMCSSKGTYYEVYVLWKEIDGGTMIKKLDNCGLFFSLPLPDPAIYEAFLSNVSRLQAEAVKPYEVANPENSPTLSTKVHPCRRTYSFKEGENSFNKSYKLYDLTNESKQKNLNYDYNNGLLIVELDKLLDTVIGMLDSQFRRQF